MEYSSSAAVKSGNTVDISNGEQVCGICHDQAEDPVVSLLVVLLHFAL